MSRLNPNAAPFVPATSRQGAEAEQRQPFEEKSLFMTFSNGSPLTGEEISQHLTREYGDCVENMYVHKRYINRDPEFGKIIFRTSDMPRVILDNKEIVRISVNSKPVWLKRYIPQNRRSNS